MGKTADELLGELDDYGRGLKRRRLIFTALPLVAILAVYAVMANAVVKRSAELDAKQAELAKTEHALAERKQQLANAASDVAIVRAQYEEAQKQIEETLKKKQQAVAALEQQGSAAAKVEKLEAILAPTPKQSARAEAMVLWKKGYDAANAGDAATARKYYEQARDKDPSYAAAQNSLGRLAYDEGNLKLADEYFVKALQSSPSYVAAIHNRALVAKKQGRTSDAASLTEQALKIRPGYQPSVILKGELEASRTQQKAL